MQNLLLSLPSRLARCRPALALLALPLLLPLVSQAQLGAQTTFSTGSGSNPYSVAAADVNGDGKPDLLVANYGSNTVGVQLNTTATNATTPSFAAQITFAAGSNPYSVAAADVNGDGKPDLLVANRSSSTVGVLLNTTATNATTASFAAQTAFTSGSIPNSVAAADVNGDGKPDLLVANYYSDNVGVLLNTTATNATTPSFAAQTAFTTGTNVGSCSVVAADVNGDGKPDLLVANSNNNTVGVLRNTTATNATTASFAAQTTFATGTNSVPNCVATADVNGDGKPDLLVANRSGNTVGVLLNTTATNATTLSFAAQTTFAASLFTCSVAAADVNGDGKPDLLVANSNSNNVGVLRNTTATNATTPTFAAQTAFTTGAGSNPNSVATADVNGDGKPDLLVANFSSDNLGVLLNQFVATPTLTAINPTSGPVGTTVTLTGTNFTAGSTVSFGSTAATVTYVSATSLTAVVPSGARTGNVTVTTSGGTTSGVSFTVTIPAPTLTSLTPTSGPVGTTVTLTGTGFAGTTDVQIGPANFTFGMTFTVVNATTITATVPTSFPYTGANDVTVTTPGGTSNAVSFTVTVPAVAPTVTTAAATSLTATSATLGGNVTADGGATITERGVVYVAGTGTPTLTDTKLTAAGTTGAFTTSATGLTASTTYNVRAYATNSIGTSYGSAVSFTTSAAAPTSLTVSTGTAAAPTSIAAGTYSDITVTSTGFATLGGAVVANGPVVVNGGLNTNCQALTGTGSFTLSAGGTLGICDAAGISASGATGAVQLSGSRSFSTDASYLYNGTAAQNTGDGLPAQVRNLSTTNANTLTLAQAVVVNQALTVGGSGAFDPNGNAVTLRSTATGTALLVNSGTGRISGTITAERYIDPTRNAGLGYRHLAAPVDVLDLTPFSSGGGAIVQNAQYNTAATPGTVTPFPTIFAYSAAQQAASPATTLSPFDKGWMSPGSQRGILGKGFTMQLTGGQTLSFTGRPQQADRSLPLRRDLSVAAADGGWNLMGNPYAAPLDFSTVLDNQRSNMDAAVYVYETTGQYVGTYRTYLMPTGSNPGVGSQPLAGSGQAFFLRVNEGQASGSLDLTNTNRVTSYGQQMAVRRSTPDTRPQLQLALTGTAGTDALTVYATAGATTGLDANYDAAKLANPTGLNLATLTAAGQQLAIDGRADFTAATRIPLFVGVPTVGSYILTAADVANLAGTRAELVDNLTNARTILTAGASYAFTTTTTTAPGRFWLNLSPAAAPLATSAAALAAQVLAYPNPSHGRFTVLRPAGTVATAELLNSLGQRVRTLTLPTAETVVDLTGLATGVYTLRLTLDGKPVIKRLMVE